MCLSDTGQSGAWRDIVKNRRPRRHFVDGRLMDVAEKRTTPRGRRRSGGDAAEHETKKHLSSPPRTYCTLGESPPRAREVSNMTDKRAAGVRPRRSRALCVGRTDAGASNMPRVRKNGTRIRRPGDDTGEKPSQVCGQSVRPAAGGRETRPRERGREGEGPSGSTGEGRKRKNHTTDYAAARTGARRCCQWVTRVRARAVSPPPRHSTRRVQQPTRPPHWSTYIILRDGRQMAHRLPGARGFSHRAAPGMLPVTSESFFFFNFFSPRRRRRLAHAAGRRRINRRNPNGPESVENRQGRKNKQ